MRSTLLAAAAVAVALYVLVFVYNTLPDLQAWIVFSAMAGMGLSLARHARHVAGPRRSTGGSVEGGV